MNQEIKNIASIIKGKGGVSIYRRPNLEVFELIGGVVVDTVDLSTFKGFVLQRFSKDGQIGIQCDYYSKVLEFDAKAFSEVLDVVLNRSSVGERYCYDVALENAKKVLDKGALEKVVISRTVYSEKIKASDAFVLFTEMCAKYKTAFVSLTFLPDGSIWIGASPENLLTVSKEGVKTCSLAGTKWGIDKLEDVEWTPKELEEQSIVTDYIVDVLKEHSIATKRSSLKTIQAGPLWHLKTEIELQEKVDVNKAVDVLHPTPAVCGKPLKESYAFIHANEGYDREFYAGYLGPVNISDSTELFVNLRCAKLFVNGALIYVGGGITASSIIEQEIAETEAKSKVISNLL